MDRQTFADNTVAQYINEHFYAVKLNAEQKDRINWDGQEFKWVSNGRRGIHTLAYALCDGKMSYPSLVFLNERFERIRVSKGFKDAQTLQSELQYIVEEQYLKGNVADRSRPTAIMQDRR